MKRFILLALVALVALPAAAQNQEAFPSYIQVTGRAEKEIVPDEFYLSVTIDERDSKGKISVESQQREMIAALKKIGVDVEKQLKVADLSSDFFKKNTAVASADYQLKLDSPAQAAKVWQALNALNISNVSIQRVANSKIAQYKAELRAEAMKNAQTAAQSLAAAVGQKTGKCFYIYDYDNDSSFEDQPFLMRSAKMSYAADNAAGAQEQPLDFKNIKLKYSVQTKFVLE